MINKSNLIYPTPKNKYGVILFIHKLNQKYFGTCRSLKLNFQTDTFYKSCKIIRVIITFIYRGIHKICTQRITGRFHCKLSKQDFRIYNLTSTYPHNSPVNIPISWYCEQIMYCMEKTTTSNNFFSFNSIIS